MIGLVWFNPFPIQFHTLPGLLDSRVALPNPNLNALRAKQGGSLYHFYDGLWYDPAERRTHDLPCERRRRYRLSQPDTVISKWNNGWDDNKNNMILYSAYVFIFSVSLMWLQRKKTVVRISRLVITDIKVYLGTNKYIVFVKVLLYIHWSGACVAQR